MFLGHLTKSDGRVAKYLKITLKHWKIKFQQEFSLHVFLGTAVYNILYVFKQEAAFCEGLSLLELENINIRTNSH